MIDFTQDHRNQFPYEDWISYFEKNDTKRLRLDFSEEKPLTEQEKKLIFPSIRAFQKGEGSDGKFLLQTVEHYVKAGGPAEYQRAMELFVKEENWHSAYLKAYLEHYGIKSAKKSALDAIFRKLRHLGGIKCEVTVLVTAEMIALTYYDALANCTDSKVLKRICQQMLDDEVPHIQFQSYTLSRFRPNRMDILLRALLMNFTLLFVWGAFHQVYRTGGYGFIRFLKENNDTLRQSVFLYRKQKSLAFAKKEELSREGGAAGVLPGKRTPS